MNPPGTDARADIAFVRGIQSPTSMIPVPCPVRLERLQLLLQPAGQELVVVTIERSIVVMRVISILDERPADGDRRGKPKAD
jgi:hypothetical protein